MGENCGYDAISRGRENEWSRVNHFFGLNLNDKHQLRPNDICECVNGETRLTNDMSSFQDL